MDNLSSNGQYLSLLSGINQIPKNDSRQSQAQTPFSEGTIPERENNSFVLDQFGVDEPSSFPYRPLSSSHETIHLPQFVPNQPVLSFGRYTPTTSSLRKTSFWTYLPVPSVGSLDFIPNSSSTQNPFNPHLNLIPSQNNWEYLTLQRLPDIPVHHHPASSLALINPIWISPPNTFHDGGYLPDPFNPPVSPNRSAFAMYPPIPSTVQDDHEEAIPAEHTPLYELPMYQPPNDIALPNRLEVAVDEYNRSRSDPIHLLDTTQQVSNLEQDDSVWSDDAEGETELESDTYTRLVPLSSNYLPYRSKILSSSSEEDSDSSFEIPLSSLFRSIRYAKRRKITKTDMRQSSTKLPTGRNKASASGPKPAKRGNGIGNVGNAYTVSILDKVWDEKANHTTFDFHLCAALHDPSTDDYIHWDEKGDVIVIPDIKAFLRHVWPHHCQTSIKRAAFNKQLANYGFRREKYRLNSLTHPLRLEYDGLKRDDPRFWAKLAERCAKFIGSPQSE
ncbi:hypothetical protein TREMEDRAFT_61513 [Tremella mesenterica DSM 1558]|uniref:uncharacterized protein n=1 Tax=Tremella mesenterica (strain ATCC 24925 / CBS 8224 / DSM 1558 / NBRC 9311 / NRRL Y-6157 / RJB 2259-6 / UBC 559-6) TaxID=578456 RepID=UPI0003F491B1|nr:uncharacterized protein TREMEDRAFT_61513 [Tremella mesenterica DSM 1558]EIW69749.1 hypothetical protein TREMEDRAFT_61513 [Tremella mesenterica DSM 1558]